MQLILVDIAHIAESQRSTARKLDIKGRAEDKVTDDTDDHDSKRNSEVDLLLAYKVNDLFAAVVLLSKLLNSHLNVSLSRIISHS